MRQLVDSHALVAFGISIFVPAAAEGEGEDRLRAHNFNFTLLRDVRSFFAFDLTLCSQRRPNLS